MFWVSFAQPCVFLSAKSFDTKYFLALFSYSDFTRGIKVSPAHPSRF